MRRPPSPLTRSWATPGSQVEVAREWGVIEDVFNVEESTIRFMQDVMDEVLALFPSEFIHVGGDEVPKKQWRESPADAGAHSRAGLEGRRRVAKLLHPAHGRVSHRARPPVDRLG